MPILRFVVLHHTGVERPHHDLLFEYEEDAPRLDALRCPQWPPAVGDVFEELNEHRPLYLDYEGPVSNGRGAVARVARGTLQLAHLAIDPPTLGLRLQSSSDGSVLELTISPRFGEDDSASMWIVMTRA